jgi:signal transduction histidine kinase
MKIGLFLNNLDEEYQLSVYRGICAETESLNIDLLCIQRENLGAYPGGNIVTGAGHGMDGILLLLPSIPYAVIDPPQGGTSIQYAMAGLPSGIPMLSLGGRLPGFPSIIIRNRKSMEALMDHLLVFHGYRKPLYLGGPVHHPDNMVRERVFRRSVNALKERFPGLAGSVINGEFHHTSGMMMLRNWILSHPDDPPDVIVAASDHIALGAQEFLRTQNDDRLSSCSITGFDDIDLARLEVPPLTTVHQPLEEMGRLAVRTLRDRILGKKTPNLIHVDSELRIRNSCGCVDSPSVQWEKQSGDENAGDRAVSEISLLRSNNAKYHLRNVSILGQSLITINTLDEMWPHLEFFLTNLAVKTFYLVLCPEPLFRADGAGELIYRYDAEGSGAAAPDETAQRVTMRDFFSAVIYGGVGNPHAWCLNYLRSGTEQLGFILYESLDSAHPQLCSAAIFIANTVKRLWIHDYETERARRLEQEVAFRTRDLTETNQKLREEAKRRIAAEADVLHISEMERLRFSMDLHDDICQRLAGISMFCKSLVEGSGNPSSFLPELSEIIDETLLRTRRYAHDSFPMEVEMHGLKESLRALCRLVGNQSTVSCVYAWSGPDQSPLSSAQDINVYRIVQEALQNAVKHAKAGRIAVEISLEGQVFTVSVQDNGAGDPRLNGDIPAIQGKKWSGLGLRSMRYRANQLGAEYTFQSTKQCGTRVEIKIPLERGSPDGSH